MQLFGISFLLYIIKWSDGAGFWSNYRNSDKKSYEQAIIVQRISKKLMKCAHAIKYLSKCRDANVFPKFTRWKKANKKDIKSRLKYQRKILVDEIRDKNNYHRKLKEDLRRETSTLYANMTYFKRWAVKHSIQKTICLEAKIVTARHEKKFDNLLKEKSTKDGTCDNPNQTIWNLSSHVLTNEEYQLLQYGLKHGLASKPRDNDILASAEALWDQIETKNLCKDGAYYQRTAKNSLRAMAFNIINLEDRQIYKDKAKVKIIKNLQKSVTLMSPDKGNGVVILDIVDYNSAMHDLFADRKKFKIVDVDPTNSRIVTLQNYIRKLRDRGEITDSDYHVMYPKNAKIGRAHGSAKIHKVFDKIPPLRPIIDTIGSTHYGVGKYISKMLNPLTLRWV